MCSRSLATIFIIYCLNTGLCEDLLDLVCSNARDCEVFHQKPNYNVTCTEKRCNCRDENGYEVKCMPALELNNVVGGPCPCKMENSLCNTENICVCKTDYTESFDRLRCVQEGSLDSFHFKYADYLKLNESFGECETNDDCETQASNSFCNRKECLCIIGFIIDDQAKQCIPAPRYNETCVDKNQCTFILGTGSDCISNLCTCSSNYSPVYSPTALVNSSNQTLVCRPNIPDVQNCTNGIDCQGTTTTPSIDDTSENMECFNGTCECKEGFNMENSVCVSAGFSKNLESVALLVITIIFILSIL